MGIERVRGQVYKMRSRDKNTCFTVLMSREILLRLGVRGEKKGYSPVEGSSVRVYTHYVSSLSHKGDSGDV